jgi:predicted ATP-grasp superfamily ATP-dependent carboligase
MMRMASRLRRILVHEYVTGGGLAGSELPPSLAAEGAAMRRAIVEDFATVAGVEVVMTLDARFAPPPGPWRTVLIGPGEERPILSRLAGTADDTLVIAPETGGILLERALTIQHAGGRSLGCTSGAIALAADKFALSVAWKKEGVPTPCTARVGIPSTVEEHRSAREIMSNGPFVLKPVDGAGSIDTYLMTNPAQELAIAFESLVQPYVTGTPLSASVLVGREGRLHLVGVGLQHVAIRASRFVYEGGTVPAPTWPPLGVILDSLRPLEGLLGWVGIDFLWDEPSGQFHFLEVNARLTTSYVGLRALLPRGELARAWLAAADGEHSDLLSELAIRVRAQPRRRFSTNGTMHMEDSLI